MAIDLTEAKAFGRAPWSAAEIAEYRSSRNMDPWGPLEIQRYLEYFGGAEPEPDAKPSAARPVRNLFAVHWPVLVAGFWMLVLVAAQHHHTSSLFQ